jgi:hypothetical protein
MDRNKKRRGIAMVEFAFTGIPLMFIWISVVQMALGMWHYHTLQYSVKQAGKYLAEHGSDCTTTCNIQIKDVATQLANNAIGIPPSAIQVTFKTISGSDHTTVTNTVSCELDTCETNSTAWPPSNANTLPADFSILAEFQWSPAIGIVTPGGHGTVFGSFWLPAYTHQLLLY